MKAYVKPELYYEDFQLSQHVAACSYIPGGNGIYVSNPNGPGSPGGTVFNIALECTHKVDGEEGNVSYCYTTGSGASFVLANS